jgi:hypothetical protein
VIGRRRTYSLALNINIAPIASAADETPSIVLGDLASTMIARFGIARAGGISPVGRK